MECWENEPNGETDVLRVIQNVELEEQREWERLFKIVRAANAKVGRLELGQIRRS